MGREVIEAGPRIGVLASPDELEKIEEGLDGAGYRRGDPFSTRERRYRHPGGSTARVFLQTGHVYVYPPGGTDQQTGPIAPFSPLKRECADANASAGFSDQGGTASSSSSDAGDDGPATPGDDPGPGDSPTDDNGATSGSDDESS